MKITVRSQLVVCAFTISLGCGPRLPTSGPATATPVGLAAPASASGPAGPRPSIGVWGFDRADIDPTVAPGASFFRYACGGWLKRIQIPADRAGYSEFGRLDDQSDDRTRDILEAAGGAPGSDAWKADEYYRTFMDEAAIEARGLAPIQPRLDAIASVATPAAVMVQLAAATSRGGSSPFRVSVDPDDREPDKYIAAISQGGLGLPDRDMYEPSARQFAALRDGYRAYIGWVFTSLGYRDAARRADAVYALEARIAHAHWTRAEARDPSKIYHRMTLAELQTLAAIDWQPWLEAVGLASQPAVIVREPSALAAIGALVKSQPIQTWRDYLALSVVSGATRYLPRRFVDARFEMYGRALSGAAQLEPRWKRAIADTVYWLDTRLGAAVAPRYVAAYFTPETKARVGVLVQNVLAAMAQRLDGLSWMSEHTKREARAKLATYRVKIGYPATWRDFSALSIIPGDAVGNAARLAGFEYDRELAHLGQPIDREEWDITPMTVNASYNPRWNEITFPAAILQPPFFDPAADAAVNYGAIGSVIGHEVSHGFDDAGSQYDGTGALRDWWSADDAGKFHQAAEKLAAQYSSYCPIPATDGKPAQCVNGKLTLGENIADLAGVTIAYTAYKLSLGGKPSPVIDGLTGDQRFFLGFAQAERGVARPEALASRLVSDPHSPDEFRISIVRNLDAWYEAFHVEPGEALYLPPDQRVRIW